jgi:hypothetical protein
MDSYAGYVYTLPDKCLEEHVSAELGRLNDLLNLYSVSLGHFAFGLDHDETMSFDAMEIEHTDEEGIRLPALYEMNEDEYDQYCFDAVVEAINALADAFKERTGVEIELWCPMLEDEGSCESLNLDDAHWIICQPIDLRPEVKSLGITGTSEIYHGYVYHC